jgi:hypothetical protein
MDAESTPTLRARRLAEDLATWPRRRIQLAELWQLLDQAAPSTRLNARRRQILSDLINELASAEILDLPSARSFDRSEAPDLPKFVVLRREAAAPELRKPVIWHPSLAWVPRASLTRSQLETAGMVNDWLHDNRDQLIVPSRERSLEIFKNEKALDRLVGSALFGPGRLTLELLRCRRVVPRLHCEPAGAGSILLVVENSDTFDSLLTVLRDRDDHRVGLVGWGAGAGFEASVLSVSRIGMEIAEIRYFGDLDEKGLRVPSNAATLASSVGLPPVRPASSLYDAMFRRAEPQQGQRKLAQATAVELTRWLAPDHQPDAVQFLTAGERVAQEAVGLSYLSRSDDWLDELR